MDDFSKKSKSGKQPGDVPTVGFLPTIGTLIFSAHLMKNAFDQWRVLNAYFTPPAWTRLSAFSATLHFPLGVVGSGANTGIQLIHSILGPYGQHQIGNVFNSRIAQLLMGAPMTSLRATSNVGLALLEHQYWVKTLRLGCSTFIGKPSDFGRIFGGLLGSVAVVPVRAAFQFGFARGRSAAPNLLNPRTICGMTGFVGAFGFVMCVFHLSDLNGVSYSINPPSGSRYRSIDDQNKS